MMLVVSGYTLTPIPDSCSFSSILLPAMAAAAEPEERSAREDRGHGGARKVCLVHSDKLLETSEKNPRFAGRVSLRDTRCVSQTEYSCFLLVQGKLVHSLIEAYGLLQELR